MIMTIINILHRWCDLLAIIKLLAVSIFIVHRVLIGFMSLIDIFFIFIVLIITELCSRNFIFQFFLINLLFLDMFFMHIASSTLNHYPPQIEIRTCFFTKYFDFLIVIETEHVLVRGYLNTVLPSPIT